MFPSYEIGFQTVSQSRLSDRSPTATLKLADFGICFEVVTRRCAGTPEYMPEQVYFGQAAGDKFMDVYASKCTLFEMIEGEMMVKDADECERAEPVLRSKSWNHANGFLRSAFNLLDKPKENTQNTNWFAYLAVRRCVKFLLDVNDDGEVSAAWPMNLCNFVVYLFC